MIRWLVTLRGYWFWMLNCPKQRKRPIYPQFVVVEQAISGDHLTHADTHTTPNPKRPDQVEGEISVLPASPDARKVVREPLLE
jgi:hypothetical protein